MLFIALRRQNSHYLLNDTRISSDEDDTDVKFDWCVIVMIWWWWWWWWWWLFKSYRK